MSLRKFFLFVCFLSLACLSGQVDAYADQIAVIEALLSEKNYRVAKVQAEALIQSGREAKLSEVEAEARLLLGLALTENAASTAKERVAGIRELKVAAQLFRREGQAEKVASALERLQQLTGSKSLEADELPSVRRLRQELPSTDSIEEASLTAIVSLQEQAISALTDSQMIQILRLRQQERELDELAFRALNDSLLLIQQEAVIEKREAEVAQERLRRNFLIALATGILLVLAALYSRFRSSKRYQAKLEAKNEIISTERKRSDELLLNILPASVAEELKTKGKATARRYDMVTVLFADFKGFSGIAAQLSPEELVNMLDVTFRAFDQIVREHGLEKIKTIGDCYMCAAGIPRESKDHAERAVRAALRMQAYLAEHASFRARIGIHSGPVVAGVVGKDKFVYDIWGDTVNQASRLETAGETGRVAISEDTKQLLGPEFTVTAAGTFEAKNIGRMRRYFVS